MDITTHQGRSDELQNMYLELDNLHKQLRERSGIPVAEYNYIRDLSNIMTAKIRVLQSMNAIQSLDAWHLSDQRVNDA